MRLHSIGNLVALAVSLAMPIAAAAQSSPPLATGTSAAIQDGKAKCMASFTTTSSPQGSRRAGEPAAWLGLDL